MGKKNNLRDSVNFARVINRLKSPDLIKIFVQNTNDKNLMNFYRIIANLIYSDKFGQNPRIKKKINKLRTIMQPFKGKWLKLTKKSSQNMREKRKFMLEQTGNGSIWSIISSILPLLLALLWFVARNSGEGKQTPQLGGLDVFFEETGEKVCTQRGTRTHDLEIRSLMLYRLS